jgi:hypothetical protein
MPTQTLDEILSDFEEVHLQENLGMVIDPTVRFVYNNRVYTICPVATNNNGDTVLVDVSISDYP